MNGVDLTIIKRNWLDTRLIIYFLFLSDEGPTFETLDYTMRIGITSTFLYFDNITACYNNFVML